MNRVSAAPSPSAACPCGKQDGRARAVAYADCCGRYIDHFHACPAPDAGSLMRSRYTAFVRENAAYLQATWAPEHRPAALDFDPGTRWLGLDVRDQRHIDADHAEVEFVARQRDATGRAHRLHERSRFMRRDGRWFYVDGELK